MGENLALDVLRPALDPETMKALDKAKPTDWDRFKTDAIGFSQSLLWLYDDLLPEEAEVP